MTYHVSLAHLCRGKKLDEVCYNDALTQKSFDLVSLSYFFPSKKPKGTKRAKKKKGRKIVSTELCRIKCVWSILQLSCKFQSSRLSPKKKAERF